MKHYDPTQPLVSLHVPKCAGSSFREVLRQWFGKNLLTHYAQEKANRLPRRHRLHDGIFTKKPRRGICIHGHFNHKRGFGVEDYYPQASQLITVLRDPFDHHVSNYFYARQCARRNGGMVFVAGRPNRIILNNWTLEEYLEHMPHSYIPNFLLSNLTLDNFEKVMDERFLYVGTVAQLQTSVDSIARILDRPTIRIAKENRSEWSETIPSGAREAFYADNELAYQLYQYATKYSPPHVNSQFTK